MSVAEFEVAGIKYRANKMDARKQFHVARRIAGSIGTGDVQSAISAIANQSDEVFDYVLDACLSVVERNDTERSWSPVITRTPDGASVLMFADLNDLAVMMQLIIPVIEANVKGFLSALPSGFLGDLVGKAVAAKSIS